MVLLHYSSVEAVCLPWKKYSLSATVEVVFGNPVLGCEGHGVCLVYIMGGFLTKKGSCRSWPGQLYLDANGYLCLGFSWKSLQEDCISRHFAGDWFEVTAPYSFTQGVLIPIGLEHYTLMPGLYPILSDQEGLVVRFQKVRP